MRQRRGALAQRQPQAKPLSSAKALQLDGGGGSGSAFAGFGGGGGCGTPDLSAGDSYDDESQLLSARDALMNSILEAEDDLIAAHRKHIEVRAARRGLLDFVLRAARHAPQAHRGARCTRAPQRALR